MQGICLWDFVCISSDSNFSDEKTGPKKESLEFTVYTVTDNICEPYLKMKWWAPCDINTSMQPSQCPGLALLLRALRLSVFHIHSRYTPLSISVLFIFSYPITAKMRSGFTSAFWYRGAVQFWNKSSGCPHLPPLAAFLLCGFGSH